jgi:amino acid transporter
MEVIIKADEWSPFDFVLARKILAERGKNMSDEDIAAINEKRIAELKVPDAPQTYWIVLGYIFALIGGLLGIFIGWFLMNYKKTLPDGEMVSEYSERDRKHGKRIFYIGIVVLVICIIYKIAPVFEDGY